MDDTISSNIFKLTVQKCKLCQITAYNVVLKIEKAKTTDVKIINTLFKKTECTC